MASNSQSTWSKYELNTLAEEEDPFAFLSQLDFSGKELSSIDWQNGLLLQESCLVANTPLVESYTDTYTGDILYNHYVNELGTLSLESANYNNTNEEYSRVKRKCRREKKNDKSNMLSKTTISLYFYMPIKQAAKELNVGLTALKKKCRELGINRWPYRKLTSLQTLIKNLHKEEEGKLKDNEIEILEMERKLMEENPDMEMKDNTKRLRQGIFKANYYKRRKFMDAHDYNSQSSSFA